ncbi:hypothetical protein FocTR4_00001553 [Fusarium oxysporum f. sp. cubense]|uniref:Uncharacterized protein n=1 Tax=Fusarium oxysporum f. sp. cubense TaxID=61366 RepID=A0A5C6SZ35_FUSOC|nr:hypothetical protein FocTR4_00001553 [Fusarium oxysporum f. sp. cubense]
MDVMSIISVSDHEFAEPTKGIPTLSRHDTRDVLSLRVRTGCLNGMPQCNLRAITFRGRHAMRVMVWRTDRHLAYIGIPRASVDSDMLVAALVSPGGSAHTPITDMPSITRTYLNPGDRVWDRYMCPSPTKNSRIKLQHTLRNTSMLDWLVECHFSTYLECSGGNRQ